MTYEARSFFQFLLNLTFLLNELNDEMLTTFKPVVLENEDLEEKNFEDNNSNQNLQGKDHSTSAGMAEPGGGLGGRTHAPQILAE